MSASVFATVTERHFLSGLFIYLFFFMYCIYDTKAWQSHCIYITEINKILSLIIAKGTFRMSSD